MSDEFNIKELTVGKPATYRIRVQGFLLHGWSERLGEMRVVTVSSKDEKPTTILEGRIKDQAELTGLVNTLYDFRLPILSVELLSID
jgi:hypothetical protein